MQQQTRIQDRFLIDGQWHESPRRMPVVNPATEEVAAEVALADAEAVDRAAVAADRAFPAWSRTHPSERGRLLYRLAQAVQKHADELAALETLEMGRPIRQSVGGIKAVVDTVEYNAGAADKLHGETIPIGDSHFDFTLREPLGVTAHIIPWNGPLGMAVRSIAPALAAGCTVVAKPAEQTPLSLLRLAELAQEVGFPDGVINIITGYGEETGEALVTHPLVRGITFTGSVETGKRVMALAAQGVKPVVLELGGKNPMIVFPDADMEHAVGSAVRGILNNCGQVCVAASRLILHRSIREAFIEQMQAHFEKVTIGDPLETPDLGPLVSREQYERVLGYIRAGQDEGARLVTGGQRPAHLSRGYFVQPAIFDRVTPTMRIAQEEIFGPVVAAIDFEDEDEALAIANGVRYGLAAGVFTRDISRAIRVTRRLQAGILWVNDWFAGGAIAPVGGYKESGIGRERGLAGLSNYLQTKNVAIRV